METAYISRLGLNGKVSKMDMSCPHFTLRGCRMYSIFPKALDESKFCDYLRHVKTFGDN